MKGTVTLLLLAISLHLSAQRLPPLDSSPMDMSYYPVGYPVLKFQNKLPGPLVMRVIYSRPQVKGRKVFGDLQKLGAIWRIGANEVTEIQFFKDVTINNKKIKKGRYSLYCIPYDDRWTLIVNKETDVWGLKYDSLKDVVRKDIPLEKNSNTEALTIMFEKADTGANMLIYWDDVKAALPIEFKN